MATWLTPDEVADWWRDAPADPELLDLYLSSTVQQILAYGPAHIAEAIAADPEAVPDSYRLAELVQVRNIWNAVKSDPASQGIGDEGFVFRPFPMDWTVKQIIRPARAKPTVA
jgi:hypothetical protein